MSQYKTGDLVLMNRWNLTSLFSKLTDKNSKWGDIGIIIVNQNNGNPNVFMLGDNEVNLYPLENILKDATIQRAVYRSYTGRNSHGVSKKIEEFAKNIKGARNSSFEFIVRKISGTLEEHRVTTLGVPVDSKGRQVKSSLIKNGYTSADLICTALANAEIIKYRPDASISDFQEGGDLDSVYGEEIELLIRNKDNDSDKRDLIIESSQEDVVKLMDLYYMHNPVSNFNNITEKETKSKNNKLYVQNSGVGNNSEEFEEINGYEIEKRSQPYIEQTPSVNLRKKKEPYSVFEADLTIHQNSRIKKLQEGEKSAERVKPSYNKSMLNL